MGRILQRIFSIYAFLVFAGLFFLLLPVFFVTIQNPRWHRTGVKLNHWWAKLFFFMTRIRYKVIQKSPLDRSRSYVFCANHTSYLDIPALALTSLPFTFVGKSSLEKVPVFGYMYRNLHITVDRSSLKGRYYTLLRAEKAVKEGRNVAFYAEGGIVAPNPPNLARFKDGPFRVAIATKAPLVPVTIPYNWIILPDDGKLMLTTRKNLPVEIVFHEPIETTGMKLDQVEELKQKVFAIIDKELKERNSNNA